MEDKLNIPQIKRLISENIKKRNLSVQQLAQIAEISNYEIYAIINGQLLPSLDTLRKLSVALDVPITELID